MTEGNIIICMPEKEYLMHSVRNEWCGWMDGWEG